MKKHLSHNSINLLRENESLWDRLKFEQERNEKLRKERNQLKLLVQELMATIDELESD